MRYSVQAFDLLQQIEGFLIIFLPPLHHLPLHLLHPQHLRLANPVVSAAVNKVQLPELAQPDGLQRSARKDGSPHTLLIRVFLVALQAHQHLQPVQAVVAGVRGSLDVCHGHLRLVAPDRLPLVDALHQICGVTHRLEVLLLQVEALESANTTCRFKRCHLIRGDADGFQFEDVSAHTF